MKFEIGMIIVFAALCSPGVKGERVTFEDVKNAFKAQYSDMISAINGFNPTFFLMMRKQREVSIKILDAVDENKKDLSDLKSKLDVQFQKLQHIAMIVEELGGVNEPKIRRRPFYPPSASRAPTVDELDPHGGNEPKIRRRPFYPPSASRAPTA